MLNPFYSLRESGAWFEYDGRVARYAQNEFFQSLPEKQEAFYESLRRMYSYLYNQALFDTGMEYILDKTPRYYHIIPELHTLFPQAHFIFLIRNPLAVLTSILRTWTRNRWLLLHRNRLDLVKAPGLILEGIERLDGKCSLVQYEDFINNPKGEIERICQELGIDFFAEIVEYGDFDKQQWLHGDKETISDHGRPISQNADKWMEDTRSPQVWRLARDYLTLLGDETVTRLGYSPDGLLEKLDEQKPNEFRLWFTYPMWFLLNFLEWTERTHILERRTDRVIELMAEVGTRDTFREIVKELKVINTNDYKNF